MHRKSESSGRNGQTVKLMDKRPVDLIGIDSDHVVQRNNRCAYSPTYIIFI